MSEKRICIIGAGPSGMSTLYNFAKEPNMPDVVCFEKQSTWGGLWNASWRTGLDEKGEPSPHVMYKYLWSNGFKDFVEFPDYSFDEHFGRPTPSFMPRAAMKDYLEGRWLRKPDKDLKKYIQFNTVVRWVKYDDVTQRYTVTVDNMKARESRDEIFTHLVIAVGICNSPFIPEIPGMDQFNGRIVHSCDFRDARDFKGQKVLVIGASYSGEDVSIQLIKFGAKKVFMSFKDIPKSATCNLPIEIEEKPLVNKIDAKKAYFMDGREDEFDSIILCTGYRNHFPFLERRFRILEKTHFYPPGLYMGALFYKEGHNNLFYIGVNNSFYTMTYFEALATWICRFIMGKIKGEPNTLKEMEEDANVWVKRAESLKSELDVLNFQTDHIDLLVDKAEYGSSLTKMKDQGKEWIRARKEVLGLATYRDKVYQSTVTGTWGVKQTPFMENFDDSLEAFLNVK